MPARVSFYRPTGQSRRQARNQHDHDVFEGLPIRRWQKQWVPYGLKPPSAAPAPELPLPKETHLLTPMNQALLQAARAGSLEKSKAPGTATTPTREALFMTNRWTCTPKHLEPPEPVYLSKLPDVPKRRTRIKKKVNGKIMITYLDEQPQNLGHAVMTQTPQAPAPPRRRPPPKRKPGRGRKPGRKVKFVEDPAAVEAQKAAAKAAVAAGNAAASAALAAEAAVVATTVVVEQQGGDVEMVDLDKATTEEQPVNNEVAKEILEREVEDEAKALEKLNVDK